MGASFLGHGSSDDGPCDRAATLHHCPSDMETITPLRLYIKLKDGSVLSGVYPWPQAVSQLAFAAKLPQFDDYTLENAQCQSVFTKEK